MDTEEELLLNSTLTSLHHCTIDGGDEVRSSSIQSLVSVSLVHPVNVLQTWFDLLDKHKEQQKLYSRSRLLTSLETIIQNVDFEKSENAKIRSLIGRLISLTSDEISKATNDFNDEVRSPCSNILVILGRDNQIDRVMDVLVSKMNSGPPQYHVITTLASLAVSNSKGFNPYITTVLLSLTANVKNKVKDHFKYAYSLAYKNLAEHIIDNNELQGDFEKYFDAGHDVLFSYWLTSSCKEVKIKCAIIDAIGTITPLLSKERIKKNFASYLMTLVSAYKKCSVPFYVTRCISSLLEVRPQVENILDSVFESLQTSLFLQIMNVSLEDCNSPLGLKNHNEALRCYSILIKYDKEKLLSALNSKLSSPDEGTRLNSLVIYKHLLTTSFGDSNPEEVVSLIQGKLNDPSTKVKSILAEMTALLVRLNYLNGSNGKDFVGFLVLGCPSSPSFDSSLQSLSRISGNFLWPEILNYLLLAEFEDSTPYIIKSMSLISEHKNKNESPDLKINYEALNHVPGSYVLLARLIVLVAWPFKDERGISILSFLLIFVTNIHKNLKELWDKKIPLLQHYLDTTGSSGLWDQKQWEHWILEFLESTLAEIDSDDWSCALANELQRHLQVFYKTSPDEKCFLIQCLGISLKSIKDNFVILNVLTGVFTAVNHGNIEESEACATAFGNVAKVHLGLVLEKCENLLKAESLKTKNQNFILNLLRDTKSIDEASVKAKRTILSCVGKSAEGFADRMDSINGMFILPSLHAQDHSLKCEALKALTAALKSLSKEAPLNSRPQLLDKTIYLIKDKDFQNKLEAIEATYELIRVKPPLSPKERSNLLEGCFNFAISFILKYPEGETTPKIRDILQLTVIELMKTEMEQSTLDELYTMLDEYQKRELVQSRRISSELLLAALFTFMNNITLKLGSPSTFAPGPYLIGSLIPRCFDNDLEVRSSALKSLDTVLKIISVYEGKKSFNSEEKLISMVDSNQTDLCSYITDILIKRISRDHLLPFFHSLIEGVLDKIDSARRGSASILFGFVSVRKDDSFSQAPALILKCQDKLSNINCSFTKDKVLATIRSLMAANTKGAIEIILANKDKNQEIDQILWKSIPSDTDLAKTVLSNLLEFTYEDSVIKVTPEEKPKARAVPLYSNLYMGLMFQNKEMEKVLVQENFESVFVPLFLCCGSYVGIESTEIGFKFPNNPFSISKNTLANFLSCKGYESLATITNSISEIETVEKDIDPQDASFFDFIDTFANFLSEHHGSLVRKLISGLEPFIQTKESAKRKAVFAFYSSIVKEQLGELNDITINIVSNAIRGEENRIVKILAIKTLGFCSSTSSKTVNGVIGILIDFLDDDDSIVVYHALSQLSVIIKAKEGLILNDHVLYSLGIKIRPYFDSGGSRLSSAAIKLFGSLLINSNKSEACDQIRSVLISVLLHLKDDVPEVASASKEVLINIIKVLELDISLIDLVEGDYDDFLDNFCSSINSIESFKDDVQMFVYNIQSYFKSPRTCLRSNATFVLKSYLIKSEDPSILKDSSSELLTSFKSLLKDNNENVKINAARNLGSVIIILFND